LTNLTTLGLRENNIGDENGFGGQKLAEAWRDGKLPHLESIHLLGNNLAISEEVLETNSPKQIFRAILDGVDLHEARLVVLGDPEAGKTWLCEKVFLEQEPKPRNETHDFEVYKSKWQPTINGDQEIALTVWDFGGQYVLHGAHEMFLTNRSIPLIVLDVTKTTADNKLKYWLRMVSHFLGKETPVIIVVSKNQESGEKRLEELDAANLQTEHQHFGPICIVENFDVNSEDGIKNLKAAITETLAQMEDLQAKVSRLQLHIKQRVEQEFNTVNDSKRRALIPVAEFKTWCVEEADKLAQPDEKAEVSDVDVLLRIVHNFGSLFFFGNTQTETKRLEKQSAELLQEVAPGQSRWLKKHKDAALENWLIHPHWLKWPLYHILRESEQRSYDGKLTGNQIDAVIQANPARDFDVPERGSKVIKEALLLTELCYFREQDQTYFFPRGLEDHDSKISQLAAALMQESTAAHELNWFFFFPEAAFHRLVVKWYKKIKMECVWRYGMVVEQDGASAVVRAFHDQGRISIDLHEGTPESQRDLFRDIKKDLVETFIGREPDSEVLPKPTEPPAEENIPHELKEEKPVSTTEIKKDQTDSPAQRSLSPNTV